MLLLDTCTLLWLVSDQKQLSAQAIHEIGNNNHDLFVSAISAFEIAIKCRNKRLELPLPSLDWFAEALDFHGIREIPVTGSIAVSAVQLPPLHNDPCDRIIIATALLNAMKIVTCDTLISQYEGVEVVW